MAWRRAISPSVSRLEYGTGAVPLSQKFFKHRSHFAHGIMRYDRSAHGAGYVIYNTQWTATEFPVRNV